MAEERRSAPPRPKAGSISFGGGAIHCTVRNVSDAGATLEVVTPLFIPDRFKLIIQSDGLNRPCHIVWRKEHAWGLRLIEARKRRGAEPAPFWKERAQL
jgi:PilZ domain